MRLSPEVKHAETLRRDYAAFVREAFEAYHGHPAIWGEYLDVMCEDIEALCRGRLTRHVLAMPPGTMKSFGASVCMPAWEWLPGNSPSESYLSVTNSQELATRDSVRCRRIIESDWYQRIKSALETIYPHDAWQLQGDQNQKTLFENTKGGFRQCSAIGANITGKRASRIIIDDVLDAKSSLGDAVKVGQRMREVREKLATAVENRLTPGRQTAILNIMQRHHIDDPAGWHIQRGWSSTVFPMYFDERIADPRDHRTEEGELLCPKLIKPEEVAEFRKTMGLRIFNAQYQQYPMVAEGGLFKRTNWTVLPRAQFPTHFDMTVCGVDLAFTGTARSDYCVAYVVGRVGARFYVLHRVRRRLEYGDQKAMLMDIWRDWKPDAFAIEKAATGAPIVNELADELPGCVPVKPEGSKEARAQVWSPIQEANQIVLPEEAEWTEDCIEQHAQFPVGSYDDDIDAMGLAVQYLREKQAIVYDKSAFADGFARQSPW